MSSTFSACGWRSKASRSARTSESICSLAVVTDVYSPSAIENEPASRPATPLSTTVWAPAVAATPAISAVLLTNPSIAPNVAARSHPPVTSACEWSIWWGRATSGGCAVPPSYSGMTAIQLQCDRGAATQVHLCLPKRRLPGEQGGLSQTYDNHCGVPAECPRRALARREERDARRTVHRGVPAALHTQHRHRPGQGGRADEDHGGRRRGRGRVQEGARRQRRRRRRGDPHRDAGHVGPVADGQGGRAVGTVRRRRGEPRHRAPPRGLRAADHRTRPGGVLRHDRDRPRQRCPVAGDDGHLRPGHRGVRHRLPHAVVAQGLHRRRGRNCQGGSGFRPADHRRAKVTACTASWCRSATPTATTCPA